MPRCQGTTKAGSRCKLPALEGEQFCHHHLPAPATLGDSQETRSIGRRIAATLCRVPTDTRLQSIIIGSVFVITFIFSRDNNYLAAFIRIPYETIIEFFSALSQALGALLGLLIALLIFRMQGADQERKSAYLEFKAEIKRLTDIYLSRPDELNMLDKDLDLIVRSLEHLKMKDLPIDFSKEYDGPSWEEMTGFVKKWQDLRKQMPPAFSWYSRQIALVLYNIEDIFNRLNIQYLNMGVIVRFMAYAIAKISWLLATSLVLLLVFGTIDRQGVFPELRLPIIFATVTWLLITISELVEHTRRLYRDLAMPWEFPD